METATTTGLEQYLTCRLGDEIFALEIGRVREVLEYAPVTALPGTPEFIRGVINLRGNVVPVVDLRLVFGMPRAEQTVNTCVIIVEVAGDEETIVLGAVADSVQEVLDLDGNEIEPAPRIGSRACNRAIKGMGKHNGRFVIILDADKLFTEEEAALVQDVEQGGSELAETP